MTRVAGHAARLAAVATALTACVASAPELTSAEQAITVGDPATTDAAPAEDHGPCVSLTVELRPVMDDQGNPRACMYHTFVRCTHADGTSTVYEDDWAGPGVSASCEDPIVIGTLPGPVDPGDVDDARECAQQVFEYWCPGYPPAEPGNGDGYDIPTLCFCWPYTATLLACLAGERVEDVIDDVRTQIAEGAACVLDWLTPDPPAPAPAP